MQQLRLLHGGDYNPEQWLDRPDILAQDIELMKKAHVNTVTLGVFSWSTLEPQEGVFELDWLQTSSITCMPMESIRSLQRPVRPAPLGWHTNTPRCAESGQTGSGSCTTGGRITAIHRRFTGKKSASSTRCWRSGSAMTGCPALAYLQRDERRLPLRAVSGRVPLLAQGTVWLFGCLEQGVERPVLESRLYRLGTNRKPCPAGGKCRAGPCAGLEALCQ